MKPLSFILPKPKIKKATLVKILIIALALTMIAGYFILQRMDRLPEVNLGQLLAKLAIIAPQEALPPAEELVPEELEITLPPVGKIYEQTAEAGEGITHLARKALREYLEDKGGPDLTPEQKIYIEDYLQNRIGDRPLELGEKISFSENLITEAIDRAQQLTPEQLENLQQYSALVPLL